MGWQRTVMYNHAASSSAFSAKCASWTAPAAVPVSPTAMMTERLVVLVLICVAAFGCRQPEGVISDPQGEQANKTDDISRDLQAVAERRTGAVDDLRSDIANLSADEPPEDLVRELTTRLNDALTGTTLPDDKAIGIARKLFVATTARDLSQRQQQTIKQEVARALADAGVTPPKAESVATVTDEIQTVMNRNRKRWWHWR